MTARYLAPYFVERLGQAVPGDTPIMEAIRRLDRTAALSLLDAGGVDVSAVNSQQETALYLALRAGQFDIAERLYDLGGVDAKDIAPQHVLSLVDDPMSEEEVDLFFANPPLEKTLTFDGLVRIRSRLSKYIERNYPRSERRQPLFVDDKAMVDLNVASLKRTGMSQIAQILTKEESAEIRDYLLSRPCFSGHLFDASDQRPISLENARSKGKYACYSPSDALTAPHLWKIANNPLILRIIYDYFGCTPTIYTSNMLWSFSDTWDEITTDSQSAHRDYDSYHFVTFFIYLSDVDAESGPHRYYSGTHDLVSTRAILQRRFSPGLAALVANDLFRSALDGYGRTGMIEELFADQIRDVTGPAGTAFLADTHGFHRASCPISKPRLIAWFRYCTLMGMSQEKQLWRDPPDAAAHAGLQFPDHDAYINRLMFRELALEKQREVAVNLSDLTETKVHRAAVDRVVQKPTIVINANCFGGFLASELRRFSKVTEEFDVHWVRNFSAQAPGDEPFDDSILPRCQLLFEQVGDFRGDPRRRHGDLKNLPVPADCRRIRFPPLFMNTLWPFIAADPRSEAYRLPWMGEGPYPKYVCNRLIMEIMREEKEPERVFQRFMEIPIAGQIDLDRLHHLTMSKIRSLDRDSDVTVGEFIERHFTTKRLFLMQIHPNGPMLRFLAEEVFRALSLPNSLVADRLDEIERGPGIGSYDAPIHPQIVEHFDIAWARNLTYRHHSEGSFDFAEFTRRYIRFDWTPSFYLGRQLAAEGRLHDAEAVLCDAVRLNPSSEFREELQKIRAQISGPPHPPMLVDTVGSYAIVRYAAQFIGIPHAAGPVDVDKVDLGSIPGVLIADQIEDVRRAIAALTAAGPRSEALLEAADE